MESTAVASIDFSRLKAALCVYEPVVGSVSTSLKYVQLTLIAGLLRIEMFITPQEMEALIAKIQARLAE